MSFLTKEIVENLVLARNPNCVVTKFEWNIQKRDLSKGFCSDSFHLYVLCNLLDHEDRVSKKEEYFFVKDPYKSPIYSTLKDLGVYERELYIYRTVLPALHQLLGEECLAPKYYWSDELHALILQDLSRENYCNVDSRKQLDFNHAVPAIKLLAKLHAASVRLNEVRPDVLEYLKQNSLQFRSFHSSDGRKYYIDHLNEMLGSVYTAQTKTRKADFLMYESRYMDKLASIIEGTKKTFKVLAHADSWANNIMFKHDELQVEIQDIKLIDFQLCFWTTPVTDVYHFFITCVQFDTFEEHSDYFLNVYVETLNQVLASLGSDSSLSLDELKCGLDQSLDYGVFIASHPLALAMADEEAAKTGNVIAWAHMHREQYKTLAFKWLTYLDNKGVFSRP